jgi:hypothetical protein
LQFVNLWIRRSTYKRLDKTCVKYMTLDN